MKQIYLTIVFSILTLHFIKAQQFNTQYFDGADTSIYNSILIDIDTASDNVWQIGIPQKSIFDSAATQPNAIITDTINNYPSNNTSSFTAKVFLNGQNYGVFALQWMQKLDIGSGFDGGIIEFSMDSGNTWINVFNNPYVYNFYGFQGANQDTLAGGEWAFSGTDSTWRDIWLCFDASWVSLFPSNDTLLFRFTFISDTLFNNQEGWMIDNMLSHITIIHTVKETEKDNHLKVYPNPAGNIVHVQTKKIMDFHIIEQMQLIDPAGKVVEEWINIPTKFWFDASKYSDGLYLLNVKTNIESETVPLVISKH